jgi:hypothetical protein
MAEREVRYDDAIVIAIESEYKEKLKELGRRREVGFTQLARRAIKEYFREDIEALEQGQEELFTSAK